MTAKKEAPWGGKGLAVVCSVVASVEEKAEFFAAAGVAQPVEGLFLDLADTLAADVEPPADLLQGVLGFFADAEAQTVNWEAIKAAERKAAGEEDTSALAGVSRGLPEWQRAVKLQSRAARVGFDWPGTAPVIDKLHEEIDEVRVELAAAPSPERDARLEDEIGDLLFVAANLARHAKVDVGGALRRANLKFERRFRAMEALAAAEGTTMAALWLEQQEARWARVKREEHCGA